MIISWNTTNQCNMYCDHCYRDAGTKTSEELSTAEAKGLIAEIAKANFKIMIFSGGEPLLRHDIFELISYAKGRGLRPVLGTNGTLISPEIACRLQESGLAAAGISLDSLDTEKHDHLRKYVGAFQQAVAGMHNCRSAGLPFQIHTTVFDWNCDELEAITDFAVQMGAMAHHFFFLVPTGRAVNIEEESLRAEQYENVITRILKKQQEVPIELKPTCAPQFMRIAAQLNLQTRFKKGCLAGTHYCLISPTGDVQPCAYLNIPLGNVKELPFSSIWSSNPILHDLRSLQYSGTCGVCAYKMSCGGCRARAYFYFGDYLAQEPWCLYHGRRGALWE